MRRSSDRETVELDDKQVDSPRTSVSLTPTGGRPHTLEMARVVTAWRQAATSETLQIDAVSGRL